MVGLLVWTDCCYCSIRYIRCTHLGRISACRHTFTVLMTGTAKTNGSGSRVVIERDEARTFEHATLSSGLAFGIHTTESRGSLRGGAKFDLARDSCRSIFGCNLGSTRGRFCDFRVNTFTTKNAEKTVNRFCVIVERDEARTFEHATLFPGLAFGIHTTESRGYLPGGVRFRLARDGCVKNFGCNLGSTQGRFCNAHAHTFTILTIQALQKTSNLCPLAIERFEARTFDLATLFPVITFVVTTAQLRTRLCSFQRGHRARSRGCYTVGGANFRLHTFSSAWGPVCCGDLGASA